MAVRPVPEAKAETAPSPAGSPEATAFEEGPYAEPQANTPIPIPVRRSEPTRRRGLRSGLIASVVAMASVTVALGAGSTEGGAPEPSALAELASATAELRGANALADGRIMMASAQFEATLTPTTEPAAATTQEGGVTAAAIIAGGGQYAPSVIRGWARDAGWPESTLDQVVAVAWCESRHSPGATNGIAYGLMQVVPLWFGYAGYSFSQWADPMVNLKVALAAYQYDLNRGYAAWTQWQCKPWMVAEAPGFVEEAVAPLPTPTPEPTSEPSATPSPSPSPTRTPTAAPVTTTPSPTVPPSDTATEVDPAEQAAGASGSATPAETTGAE